MPAFKKVKDNGRPSKISDEIIEKICNSLRIGSYIETAAAYAEVGKPTLYEWMRLGNKKPNSIYGKFLNAVTKAMSDAEHRDLFNIDKCAMGQDWDYERYPKGSKDANGNDIEGQLVLNSRGNPVPKKVGTPPDWQASAWRLERRHPKRWSKTEKIEQTATVVTSQETPEEKQKRLERATELVDALSRLKER